MRGQKESPVPQAFIRRRLHSLTGAFIVLFLCEHLLTNSQAALLIGDDGNGFVRMVNLIHSLPYLPAIEFLLLAVPIGIHAVWGVRYLFTAKPNSLPGDGSRPALARYPRNHFFTWQRITSWILLVGILAHVTQMRFLRYPEEATLDGAHYYMVKVSMDEGLYTVAHRLGVQLMDIQQIRDEEEEVGVKPPNWDTAGLFDFSWWKGEPDSAYEMDKGEKLIEQQREKQKSEWMEAVKAKSLKEGEVIAVAQSMGTAILLNVRDVFKNPWMVAIYTFYVLAACFHAFNGLWTCCITWGLTLTPVSQNMMRVVTTALMLGLACLGLAAVWGTYWLNLYN